MLTVVCLYVAGFALNEQGFVHNLFYCLIQPIYFILKKNPLIRELINVNNDNKPIKPACIFTNYYMLVYFLWK